MAHHFMFDPDPAKRDGPTPEECAEGGIVQAATSTRGDWDVAELTARFRAHAAGRVSAEISADLALDIVLNEIVEQACLATPATGAAMVLQRDGEWVCRASHGGNAPQLGARLDAETGLSGACIRTRQIQRCDDARTNAGVDVEACRKLGVRSVMVLPLVQDDDLAGVLEVFSPNPSAFGERDERTLEALSQLVLKNLARASEPEATASNAVEDHIEQNTSGATFAEPTQLVATPAAPSSVPAYDSIETVLPGSEASGVGLKVITWVLGTLVVAAAVLLAVTASQRFGGKKVAARGYPASSAPASSFHARNKSEVAGGARDASVSKLPSQADAKASPTTPPSGASGGTPTVSRAPAALPPAGSLRVYENGKEIFRMMPAAEKGVAGDSTSPQPDAAGASLAREHAAPGIESASIYELPPALAEGSLIYRVEPEYPEQARQLKIQGPVVLEVRAARDGSIQEVKLLSGQRLLADAAIAAVKQWRFQPRKVHGQPAEMQTTVTLNFRLPQ